MSSAWGLAWARAWGAAWGLVSGRRREVVYLDSPIALGVTLASHIS